MTWRETDVTWQETDVTWQETDAALEILMLVAPAGRATAHFLKNIMTSSGNCGVVAPLTYNSKRKKVGGGIRENGMAP